MVPGRGHDRDSNRYANQIPLPISPPYFLLFLFPSSYYGVLFSRLPTVLFLNQLYFFLGWFLWLHTKLKKSFGFYGCKLKNPKAVLAQQIRRKAPGFLFLNPPFSKPWLPEKWFDTSTRAHKSHGLTFDYTVIPAVHPKGQSTMRRIRHGSEYCDTSNSITISCIVYGSEECRVLHVLVQMAYIVVTYSQPLCCFARCRNGIGNRRGKHALNLTCSWHRFELFLSMGRQELTGNASENVRN